MEETKDKNIELIHKQITDKYSFYLYVLNYAHNYKQVRH